MNDKDFCFLSFLVNATVLCFTEVDICLNTKGFIPGRRLAVILVCLVLIIYQTDFPCHLILKHKLILDRKIVSKFTILDLIKS